jgi:protein phosphatase
MWRFAGAGVSDVGLVRDSNEDAAFVAPYVTLVADGVGGAAAGEVASATTAYVVAATARGRFGEEPARVLHDAVVAAGAELVRGVSQDPARTGMATTLSVVVCDGRRVVLGHVGDSRVYVWRDGTLRQVSHDHTLVQTLVDAGRLAPEDVRTHPMRNVVLRWMSSDARVGSAADVDITTLDVAPGDRLLLCSDGLTDLVSDGRIAAELAEPDAQTAAAALTHAALVAGGKDNVTCVVTDVVDGPVVAGDGTILGALRDPANVIDPAAVRLVRSTA